MTEPDDREQILLSELAAAYEAARAEVFNAGRRDESNNLSQRQYKVLIALEGAELELITPAAAN